MRPISSTFIAIGLAGALGAATPYAQTTPARPDTSRQTQPRDDKANATASADMEFARKAAEGGKKEVESAKMAASKATNADVKAYANRLIADHTKANNELQSLMKNKRMSPAPADKGDMANRGDKADKSDRAAMGDESWRQQTGAAFDRAWIEHAIADHEKTIALFETETREGTDAELKAWAQKTLPTLREHLQQAQNLKTKTTSSQQ
jgi:putative membrane protein